jgi:hypothetical protein
LEKGGKTRKKKEDRRNVKVNGAKIVKYGKEAKNKG